MACCPDWGGHLLRPVFPGRDGVLQALGPACAGAIVSPHVFPVLSGCTIRRTMPLVTDTFQIYWEDMDRCRESSAFWSLLHVTVCLPDICAALESRDGISTGGKYMLWCNRWLKDRRLWGAERWRMRCKVLHQGRASTDRKHWRYKSFIFSRTVGGPPVADLNRNAEDVRRLHVDVGELATETRKAVESWIAWINANPLSTRARNAQVHSASLVQVRRMDSTNRLTGHSAKGLVGSFTPTHLTTTTS
jgi:hypothetical protein